MSRRSAPRNPGGAALSRYAEIGRLLVSDYGPHPAFANAILDASAPQAIADQADAVSEAGAPASVVACGVAREDRILCRFGAHSSDREHGHDRRNLTALLENTHIAVRHTAIRDRRIL